MSLGRRSRSGNNCEFGHCFSFKVSQVPIGTIFPSRGNPPEFGHFAPQVGRVGIMCMTGDDNNQARCFSERARMPARQTTARAVMPHVEEAVQFIALRGQRVIQS